jgi:3-phenylpropionate/trans-cinnamate dioxygenase ferredoxin reductase subunit
MASAPIVVIGAGHAAIQLVVSLREEGYQEEVLVLSDESDLPYQRPQLSKAFLKAHDAVALPLRAEQFYRESRIDLLLGEAATQIDLPSRRVRLRSGRTLDYGHLVIASGSRARPFDAPGAALEGVAILRSLSDARSLRHQLVGANAVVVVGAGFIGLEVAATAAGFGKEVTIVEIGPRVLGRAVSPSTSSFFARAHESFGATVLLNAGVAALRGPGRVRLVELTDGRSIPADLVVVGVGVLPEDRLALASGIKCANGIMVDDQLKSSDRSISAIGDCAAFRSHLSETTIRLESVQNAVDQARCTARRLVGRPKPYMALPWFWSDQGDLKLQIAGLSHGVDHWVVRGEPESRSFAVFGYRSGVLSVVETVNRPGDHMASRKLLEARTPLSPAEAADPNFDLRRRATPSIS